MKLGWKPELNDLPKMIEHAHNWEKKLTAIATATRGRAIRRARVAGNSSLVPAAPGVGRLRIG
jgi:hypothetical protein